MGVSRAISTLGPVLDTAKVINLDNVGTNPMHEKNLNVVKNLSRKKRYRFSKILKDITRNRNLGINIVGNLLPKKARKSTAKEANGDRKEKETQIAWVN